MLLYFNKLTIKMVYTKIIIGDNMKKVMFGFLCLLTIASGGFLIYNCNDYLQNKDKNESKVKEVEEVNDNIEAQKNKIQEYKNKYEEVKDSSKEKIEEYEKWKKMLKEIQDLL